MTRQDDVAPSPNQDRRNEYSDTTPAAAGQGRPAGGEKTLLRHVTARHSALVLSAVPQTGATKPALLDRTPSLSDLKVRAKTRTSPAEREEQAGGAKDMTLLQTSWTLKSRLPDEKGKVDDWWSEYHLDS